MFDIEFLSIFFDLLYWITVNKIHIHNVTFCRGNLSMDAITSRIPHGFAILRIVSDERDLFGWVEQEEQGRRRKLNENVGNEREREREYKLLKD